MSVEIVIGYDKDRQEYRAYEPTTDTLLVTTSLGETFLRLSDFLQQSGLIAADLLNTQDVTYHLDSPTFIAMVESNANLLKRLQKGPSGFQVSQGKLGQGQNQLANTIANSKNKKMMAAGGGIKGSYKKTKNLGGNDSMFSRSGFNNSRKKFGK